METLADRIAEKGKLDTVDAVTLAARITKWIEVVHASEQTHGAISLEAIVLRGGDFRRAALRSGLRAEHLPSSQSPERLAGGPSTVEDDIWAIGTVLYAALTGHTAFAGSTPEKVLSRIENGGIAPLAVFDVGDDDLADVIERLLHVDRGVRLRSAEDLRIELDVWLENRGRASGPMIDTLDDEPGSIIDLGTVPPPPGLPDAAEIPKPSKPFHETFDEDTTLPKDPLQIPTPGPSTALPFGERLPPTSGASRTCKTRDVATSTAALAASAGGVAIGSAASSLRRDATTPAAEASAVAGERYEAANRSAAASASHAASEGRAPPPTPPPVKSTPPPLTVEPNDEADIPPSEPVAKKPRVRQEPADDIERPRLDVGPKKPSPSRSRVVPIVAAVALVVVAGYVVVRFIGGNASSPANTSVGAPTAPPTSTTTASATRFAATGVVPTSAPSSVVLPPSASVGTSSPVESALPTAPSASSAPSSPENREACFEGLLAAGALEEGARPDFGFVCDESDPRRGAPKVRSLVVLVAHGHVTDAMREWAVLGSYELAAYAAMRGRCCAAPRPIELPPSPGSCPSMQDALNRVSAAAHPGVDESEQDGAAKGFREALLCVEKSGRMQYLGDYQRVSGGQDTAFLKTLQRTRR